MDERELLSGAIMRQLEQHPRFQQAQVVLLYASLPDEVSTMSFIERWSATKQILLPVVVGDVLQLRRYTATACLQTGSFGIPEPTRTPEFTDYASIDLAIIPGVAFTPGGQRLGRGRGYYDRLLEHPLFANVYKLGICFPCQMFPELPCSPHDVNMDAVITHDSANSTVIFGS